MLYTIRLLGKFGMNGYLPAYLLQGALSRNRRKVRKHKRLQPGDAKTRFYYVATQRQKVQPVTRVPDMIPSKSKDFFKGT